MTTSAVARQPKGIPVGGQFAPDQHAEPQVGLEAPEPNFTEFHVSYQLEGQAAPATEVFDTAAEARSRADAIDPGEHGWVTVDPVPVHLDSQELAQRFGALMTDELAADLDARLKAGVEAEGSRGWQRWIFESESDGEGGLYIYTRAPGAEEGATYTAAVLEGLPKLAFNDDYGTGPRPRDLHPGAWAEDGAAAKEIAAVVLDLGGDVADSAPSGGTPDGFASDADYWRWKER